MATSSFRSFVPSGGHPRLGPVNFKDFDIYSWVDFGLQKSFIHDLWEGWQNLYAQPFRGITSNEDLETNLFTLRKEYAPVEKMVNAAVLLIQEAEKTHTTEKLRYSIDADEWRCWMNPEFYFARNGVRLEEIPKNLRNTVLSLMETSLSKKGYEDVLAIMRLNGFLGNLVDAPHLLNEYSYNFILFGDPSVEEPWGWSLWGHHLTFCVFILGTEMVISPVFRGCEPDSIDEGQYAGTVMFTQEVQLATHLMKTLSDAERNEVIIYKALEDPDMPPGFPHPADGRNLAGAYEDNKIIPYTGAQVKKFSNKSQQVLLDLVRRVLDFLPEGPLAAKMDDVKQYLDRTWFLWMGGYGDHDVFHFRIHSPIFIYEFDHECGMWLTNDEPRRFHVHTILRTPNGNDYGKELLRLWRSKS